MLWAGQMGFNSWQGWRILLFTTKTDSGAHQASYLMGTRGSFLRGKAARV